MSLFGALMGDIDDDPFFGGHMRRMNTMMNSFFRDPFGDIMGTELMPFGGRPNPRGEVARFGEFGMGFPMMPMGFPPIGGMFQSLGNNPNCHSFSSSTVMTMTPGPDGRPQVYQASQTVKQGPGGIKETQKTVADSRTGLKKMAIGHHINERAHIIEREQNVYSGEQEERQDFINLDEDEAETFNHEWETKASHVMRSNALKAGNRRRPSHQPPPMLALPSTSSTHKASEDEDEEEEKEDGDEEEVVDVEETNTLKPPEKRKLTPEVLSSSEEEDDGVTVQPRPKKLMKTQETQSCPKKRQTQARHSK